MSDQSISTWIRQPASIILIIALAIITVMFLDQSSQPASPVSSPVSSMKAPAGTPMKKTPTMPTAPAPAGPIGGELPKIVRQLGGPAAAPAKKNSQPGQLTAPDLGSLLGRMEDKVKAEPDNINNRLLLAQTYSELGLEDKAIQEARTALELQPDHARAKLVLSSVLSKRKAENELNEAIKLLKSLQSNPDVKRYLVDMYLGDAWIHLGDHESAVASWKMALEGMPVSDNRRAMIEKNISEISRGNPGS
jgi:tetratricopeptide (TPR) repeat protein